MKITLNKLKNFLLELQPPKSSLVGAMQHLKGEDLANSKSRKVGGIPLEQWTPYKPFPNITRFRIVVTKLNEILLKMGIKKRLDKAGFDFTYYRNRDLNRYVAHTINRLDNMTDQSYYNYQLILMRRSRTWYMLGMRHVFPRWHREMPWWKFMKLRKAYLQICKAKFPTINFKRVYIEKSGGKWRPLGVPRPEWRVYLHLMNQALVHRLAPKLKENQHGFIPDKGTLTAWIEILSKVISSPNIYEFDLKGYFDNLNQAFMNQSIKALGVNGDFLDKLKIINRSLVSLTKKDLIVERDRDIPFAGDGLFNMQSNFNPNRKKEQTMVEWFKEFRTNPIFRPKAVWDYLPPEGIGFPQKALTFVTAEHTNLWAQSPRISASILTKASGVPQGAPTSPFLSNASLDASLLELWKEIVQYADDGIMYGKFLTQEVIDQVFSHALCMSAGIIISLEKSGWVKKDGIWLKPLKFLGLEYDGEKNELRASTRKGSKLIYDKASLLEALEEGYYNIGGTSAGKPAKPMSWERFAVSKYTGWILSRLYNGSWNQEEYVQNFSLTYSKGTWVSEYIKWARVQEEKNHRRKAERIKELLLGRGSDEPENLDMLELNEEIQHLTVFNVSSIATRAALEALRLAEGMPELQLPTTKGKVAEVTPPTPKKSDVGATWSTYNKYQKMNIHRWYKAWGGSWKDFLIFITLEIDRMEQYSKFTRKEMYQHYSIKYVEHKEQQIIHTLKKGELLCDEVRRELKLLKSKTSKS